VSGISFIRYAYLTWYALIVLYRSCNVARKCIQWYILHLMHDIIYLFIFYLPVHCSVRCKGAVIRVMGVTSFMKINHCFYIPISSSSHGQRNPSRRKNYIYIYIYIWFEHFYLTWYALIVLYRSCNVARKCIQWHILHLMHDIGTIIYFVLSNCK
jgi:hypothetical protein